MMTDKFIELQTSRLMVLTGGRPVELRKVDDAEYGKPFMFTISGEIGEFHVDFLMSESDFEIDDDDLTTRVITPTLHCLDSAMFPDRTANYLMATRHYAELLAKRAA